MKTPVRINAKSLSDALPHSKKKCLRRWPPAILQGFRIYSWSAHCLPDFCQKGCPGVWISWTKVTRSSFSPQLENVSNFWGISTIRQCRQVEAARCELSQTRPHCFHFQIPAQLFVHVRPVFAVTVYFSLFHQSYDSCSLRSLTVGLA